jgi:hypothetical protein
MRVLESAAGHRRRSPSLAHRPGLQGDLTAHRARIATAAARQSASLKPSVATCPESLQEARRTSMQGFSLTRGRAVSCLQTRSNGRPGALLTTGADRRASSHRDSSVLLPTAQTPFLALNLSRTVAGSSETMLPRCASQQTSTSPRPSPPHGPTSRVDR